MEMQLKPNVLDDISKEVRQPEGPAYMLLTNNSIG